MHDFDPIIECVSERIRGERYSDAGADRGKNTRPTIMLLHEARLIVNAREDRMQIFQVTRIVLVGQPNDGWTVASRLLFHERDAVGGGSPYIMRANRTPSNDGPTRKLVSNFCRSYTMSCGI